MVTEILKISCVKLVAGTATKIVIIGSTDGNFSKNTQFCLCNNFHLKISHGCRKLNNVKCSISTTCLVHYTTFDLKAGFWQISKYIL